MDNVLRVCNNGSGGNDDDECSDLGGGCSDGDGEGGDDDDGGNGVGDGAMAARMTVVTVVANLRQ
jgi:hypothetical protein